MHLHTCGDTRNGEIGAAGRVEWVGWLDTGLGSMHTARPTPLLRRHLALSSSLNPLQSYRRLDVLLSRSLSLSFSYFLSVSFVTSFWCFPLLFPLSGILLFVLASRFSFHQGSSIGEFRGVRRSEVEGMKTGCRRVGIPRGSKEDSLWMVIVRRRSRLEYTLEVGKRRRGWFLSYFSVAKTNSNRQLQITGNITPLSHFFLASLIRVDSRSFGSFLGTR